MTTCVEELGVEPQAPRPGSVTWMENTFTCQGGVRRHKFQGNKATRTLETGGGQGGKSGVAASLPSATRGRS